MAPDTSLSLSYLMAYRRPPLVDLQSFLAQIPEPVVANLVQVVEDALAQQGFLLDRETLRTKVIPELEQSINEKEHQGGEDSVQARIKSLLARQS